MSEYIHYQVMVLLDRPTSLIHEEKTFWIARKIDAPLLVVSGIQLYVDQIDRELRRNKLLKKATITYDFHENHTTCDKVHRFVSYYTSPWWIRTFFTGSKKYTLKFLTTTDNFKPKRIVGRKIK
jgi:hypothetical protein